MCLEKGRIGRDSSVDSIRLIILRPDSQGKGEMRTYWLIGKTRPSSLYPEDSLGQQQNYSHQKPSIINCDRIDDLREFSESCLRDSSYRHSFKPDPYNLKISDTMLNRFQRLGPLEFTKTRSDRFRRIKSCASDDKYNRRTKCDYLPFQNRNQATNISNLKNHHHGTSCLNLITDFKEKV